MKPSIVLTQTDIDYLESLDDGATIYAGRIADYIEAKIKEGIDAGRFTEAEARQDLTAALMLSHALLNLNDYVSYVEALKVLLPAKGSAAGCGVWFYRTACAYLYSGRIQDAVEMAEAAVREEPSYPWGWLMAGKLRAHQGNKTGALEAVARGLELVPNDAEFLTLKREIEEGASLLRMEYHHIDPSADQALQANDEAMGEILAKRRSIACIEVDSAGLSAVWDFFNFTMFVNEDVPDIPYCEGKSAVAGPKLTWRFMMNAAGLSHMSVPWLRLVARELPKLFDAIKVDPETIDYVLIRQDRIVGLAFNVSPAKSSAETANAKAEDPMAASSSSDTVEKLESDDTKAEIGSEELVEEGEKKRIRYFDMRTVFADSSETPTAEQVSPIAPMSALGEGSASSVLDGTGGTLEADEPIPEDEAGLLQAIARWNARNDFKRIIDVLEALPAERRTDTILGELARAYNNLAMPGDDELFLHALDILRLTRESGKDSYLWHFRVGYALFYLDREGEALPYFERALELRPGDEDTMSMIAECRRSVTLPRFHMNFSERVEACWKAFAEEEAAIRDDLTNGRFENALFKAQQALRPVASDWSIELASTQEDGQYSMVLSTDGRRTLVPPMLYFVGRLPDTVAKHWKVHAGRAAGTAAPDAELVMSDETFSAADLKVWLNREETGGYRLVFYGPIFEGVESSDAVDIFARLARFVDHSIGEAAAMRWLSGLTIARREPEGEGFPLAELSARFFELIPEARDFTMASLADVRLDFWLKPETDPEADLYWDIGQGWTSCPAFINEYRSAENDEVDALARAGIAIGFFYFEGFKTLDPEERTEAAKAFLAELEEKLKREGGEFCFVCGAATGLYRFYLDCYAWQFGKTADCVVKFIADHPEIESAGWHTFRRLAGSVLLKQKETEPEPTNGTPEPGRESAEKSGSDNGAPAGDEQNAKTETTEVTEAEVYSLPSIIAEA